MKLSPHQIDKSKLFPMLDDIDHPHHLEYEDTKVFIIDGNSQKIELFELDHAVTKGLEKRFGEMLVEYWEATRVKGYLEGLGVECCGEPMDAVSESTGVPEIGMAGAVGGLGGLIGGLMGSGSPTFPLCVLVCFECGHFRLYSRQIALREAENDSSG
jgi:hypothetical protein